MRFLSLAVLLALSLIACDSAEEASPQQTPPQQTSERPPPVVYAPKSDAEMSAAVVRARSELSAFTEVAKAPREGQTGFGVKVAVIHPGGEEHLWLGQPTFVADSVIGIVEDVPMYVKGVTRGTRLRAHQNSIADWMYLENGKLRGGYTERVAIERLPADQREKQKKAFGIE